MKPAVYRLDMVPRGASRPRAARGGGRVYMPPEHRAWMDEAVAKLREQREELTVGRLPIDLDILPVDVAIHGLDIVQAVGERRPNDACISDRANGRAAHGYHLPLSIASTASIASSSIL